MKRHLTLAFACAMAFIGIMWLGRARPTSDGSAPLPPTPKTRAVSLFSLYYGEAADRIGVYIPPEAEGEGEVVAGPSYFTVARDGTLWFADAVNNQVKQFDRTGRLLRRIKTRLPHISALSVDANGYVYVYNGGDSQFEVFDSQAQPLPQIAQRFNQAVRTLGPLVALIDLRVDANGNLYGQTFLKGQEVTVKITSSGQVTILPPGEVDYRGRIWEGQRLEDRMSSVRVYKPDGQLLTTYTGPAFVVKQFTVYDTTGHAIRRFIVPSTGLSQLEQSLSEITSYRVGEQEHLYLMASSLTLQWENVVGRLKVLRWYVILEYDNQGNRIGVRAVLSKPNFHGVMVDRLWDVDQTGNVYYLDLKADHLDVMMAPTP